MTRPAAYLRKSKDARMLNSSFRSGAAQSIPPATTRTPRSRATRMKRAHSSMDRPPRSRSFMNTTSWSPRSMASQSDRQLARFASLAMSPDRPQSS